VSNHYSMKHKKLQQVLLILLLALLPQLSYSQITIPSDYYGINAWMPDSVGTKKYYGRLDQRWSEIEASNPQIIRMGGIAPDRYFFSNYQLLNLIDSIQAIGAEPIVQVPVWGGTATAAHAASVVEFVNITYGRNIKYWSIGNEPNHVYDNEEFDFGDNDYGVGDYATAVREFSIAMKTVDSSIKTIAGELAWYNIYWIEPLFDANGDHDISGNNGTHDYIDFFSFHRYPFSRFGNPQFRDTVITSIGAFEKVTNELNILIETANTTHSRNNALQYGISEININTTNPVDNSPEGIGSNSFIGGQWWADVLMTGIQQKAQFMTFWSAIEGSDGSITDNGYISHTTGKLKPLYYHFQMCASNLQGTLYPIVENQDSVKVYATQDASGDWNILVLNYNETQGFDTKIRLDNATISGAESLKINIAGGLAKEIDLAVEANSTTLIKLSNCGVLKYILDYTQTHASNDEPPQLRLTPRDKKVFAHYLPWYDSNDAERIGWCYDGDCSDANNAHYSNKPRIGEYSQYDPAVIEYHVLTAHVAGIDGFIINLNVANNFQKQVTQEVLQQLNTLKTKYSDLANFKIIISYDNNAASASEIVSDLTYIHDNIYQATAYKDLIFVDEVTGQQVLQAWSEVDNQAYYTTVQNLWTCGDIHLMIRNPREYDYSDGNFQWVNGFNSTNTETANWGQQYYNDFDWAMARQEQFGLTDPASLNQLMMGMVYPGFNDENVPAFWNGGNTRYILRQVDDGETMSLTWNQQIDWTTKRLGGDNDVLNPWTQIITWNDWPEGTSIEPASDDTYGYTPLKTNRTKIAEWKSTTAPYAELCLEVPYYMYLAREASDNTLADDAAVLLLQGDCEGAYNLLTAPSCTTDIVLVTNTESEYCATDSLTSSAVLDASDVITYKAENTIILESGFTVPLGAELLATIEECCSDSPITQLEEPSAKFILTNKEKKIQDNNLHIAPNPFEETLTLNYATATTVDIFLLNSMGQLSWQGQFSPNQIAHTLSTTSLQSGIYFVKIVQDGKIVATEKIIKVTK